MPAKLKDSTERVLGESLIFLLLLGHLTRTQMLFDGLIFPLSFSKLSEKQFPSRPTGGLEIFSQLLNFKTTVYDEFLGGVSTSERN